MSENIRGLVYGKYKSIRKFAEAVGWDRTKACDIVNETREPRVSELQDMAIALERPVGEIANIFLRNKSQKCDKTA